MSIDNRSANGKPDSRAGGLRRKERLENTVLIFPIYTRSRVLEGDDDIGSLLRHVRSYPQLACIIWGQVHCLDRIDHKVKEDLSQYALSPEIHVENCEHLPNEVVYINPSSSVSVLSEHSAKACNHLIRASICSNDVLKGGPD
jgi:hypothetical protein